MEQLSGIDTAFIHQDSSRTPMHICAVLLYDCAENQLDLAELEALVTRRLARFPLFHRRLKRVAMGMDTPYWREVPQPDWSAHLQGKTLGTDATWNSLMELLARYHGERMKLRRPLWEMLLVDDINSLPGLPQACQALVIKIHHAAIDGISMAAIIQALHSEEQPGKSVNGRDEKLAPWRLWQRVHINQIGRQMKLAETLGNLVPGFMRARETRKKFSDLPAIHSGGAQFNTRIERGRSVGVALLPRHELVAIKRAVRHVTLNDIAMSCVAGALRHYLSEGGKLPAESLASGVPINLRDRGEPAGEGNKIATMVVGLATHAADPVERLRLIHRYAVAGKKQISSLGTDTLMDISDSLSPGVLAEGIRTMARASEWVDIAVPFHTMISNVPGPESRLTLGDGRLITAFGLGPVRDNMALFHIVSGGPEHISIAFSACRRCLPDGPRYQQYLEQAFAELKTAALEESGVSVH